MDPQIFECTWWRYKRDAAGELVYGPFVGAVSSPIMVEIATGRELPGNELPVGALWSAPRRPSCGPDDYPRVGYDGLSIMCRLSDGHSWNIEGRASNCTMPEEPHHRCWVRHGSIGERVTVDKNGLTCGAGAGSFYMGPNNEWHGFLRDGRMTP